MWCLRISEAVFKTLSGDVCCVLWDPVLGFFFLCVCRLELTQQQGYNFQWPLSPPGSPPVQSISAYASPGDPIKNADSDSVGLKWGLRLCISRWCWRCRSADSTLSSEAPVGLFFICPSPSPGPFSALWTAAPGHLGLLACRWVGPMGGGVSGLGQWEVRSMGWANERQQEGGGGESGEGISSFPAEPYCCLRLPTGDFSLMPWLPRTLSSRPKAAVEGRTIGSQRCPCPNPCNLWIQYFTWQRGLCRCD